MALAAWAAFQCSVFTLGCGGFALRFSLNFLAGYAVFVSLLAFWLWTKPTLDRSLLLAGAPESIETKNPWDDEAVEQRAELIEHASRSAENQARGSGAQGLIGLAMVALILGTFFVARTCCGTHAGTWRGC